MKQPLVHAGNNWDGHSAFEYRLPVEENALWSGHNALLTPWLLSVLPLTPNQLQERLMGEWRAIESGSVRNFALSFRHRIPRSVIISEGHAWLALEHPVRCEDSIRIRGPRSLPDVLQSIIASMGVPGLDEFFVHFRDLRERMQSCTNMIWDEPGPLVSEEKDAGDIRDWEGSLEFYYIMSGDAMMIKEGGAVASWSHEFGWGSGSYEEMITPIAPSFEVFLNAYASYLDADDEEKQKTVFF